MSGQKTPMFNIAVAPDRLNEAVRSNLEKLRADDERIRCNLDRIFETERRLHSTFRRITREIAGKRVWMTSCAPNRYAAQFFGRQVSSR